MAGDKVEQTTIQPFTDTSSSEKRASSVNIDAQPEVLYDEPNSNRAVDGIPDGGVEAWLVVLGAWCGMVCTYGWLNSGGTFQSYYELTILSQYSASDIAWIPSLVSFWMLATGPLVGRLFDYYGPRYLILGGSILHVFGLMMASISTNYYQIMLSQGVCSALGLTAIIQPAMTSIPGWFERKRGLAYGIASTGSSIGGVIYPIMISHLINEVGYGWAMRISAFMILALLIIVNLTVKTRTPPQPQVTRNMSLLQPFKELPMMLLTVGFFLLGLGVYVPSAYSIIQAIHDGMSVDLAQYMLAILNAASLVGRLLSGVSADRIGVLNTMCIACYLAGIITLALWIPVSNNAGNIMFSILFGFAIGAYETLATAIVASLYPLEEIGYRMGFLYLLASVGTLASGSIAGAIIDDNGGSYTGMKVFAGVVFLSGSTFVLITRLYNTKWVIWVKA